MKKILSLLVIGVFVVLMPAPLSAQSKTLTVTATVASYCQFDNAPLPFGTYTNTDVVAEGAIDFWCTDQTSWHMALDQGLYPATGSSDTAPLRQMASGSNRLRYDIYMDAGRTQIWGAGAAAAAILGHGAPWQAPVYGTIPGLQYKPVGNYTDTVVISITF